VSALALILLVYILHLLLTTTGLAETFKKDGNLVLVWLYLKKSTNSSHFKYFKKIQTVGKNNQTMN